MWPFNRKAEVETRASGSGFTAEIMAAREAYVSGQRGIAELTATAQGAVSLWEGGLSLADVTGTDLLDRRALALSARSLALRGEAVFLICDKGLVACSDWDLRTRDGFPTAYRVSVSEAGGGRSLTVLAAEVLHLRVGCDVAAPYYGTAPLKRASLTAGLLNALESALAEVFELAPLGTSIVPFPEAPQTDLEAMARGFRGNRGKVLVRESVAVAAAGGPAPSQDWKPQDVTPDLSKAMTRETLAGARDGINMAFGILPAMNAPAATGPLIREGQRHLAQWVLQPIAAMIGEEATAKLGQPVTLDVMQPLQAYDAGGRARALSGIVKALSEAKKAGLSEEQTAKALALVGWADG
ncbi:MAG: hypothetical protein P1U84_17575 [Parvibaculaceae bacterium]|nr:hypothetical protein [Parvibaculaceae bacterium]